jgi:hypothetical protein
MNEMNKLDRLVCLDIKEAVREPVTTKNEIEKEMRRTMLEFTNTKDRNLKTEDKFCQIR